MLRAIGRRLRHWRAGDRWRVGEDPRFNLVPRLVVLTSPAFADGEPLPPAPPSPPLRWTAVPPETRTIALIVEDVDAPLPRPLAHAVAYAIDPGVGSLPSGALDAEGGDALLGVNGAGKRTYLPPSPIPGHGTHRYVFTLLAVDFVPRFDQPPTRGRLLDAVAGHVVALAELTGTATR